MTTNCGITLYHKKYNSKAKIYKWEIYHIKNVMWQGGKGASINKGYEKANDISLFIPYYKNPGLDKIPIKIGDIVVQGIIKDTINIQSDLKVDNFNITTCIPNKYGRYEMQHIFIGAK